MKRWFRRYSLSAGSAGYGAAMALALALLLLAGVTPAAAQLDPPHQFYGNVYTGALSSPVAAGTRIEARINGAVYATTVDSLHRYGYSPVFKVPGSTGTVTFYIGATKALQEVAWAGGGINRDDGQPLHLSDTAIALSITTTTLTGGQVGTFYTRTLGASGGTTPYTWSISVGSLPAGLSLTDNVISGTPTGIETATFTVQVTDAATPMSTKTQSLSITISAAAPVGGEGGQLIGFTTGTATGGYTPGYALYEKWTCDTGGTLTSILVYGTNIGNVKAALFADSGGAPTTLLAKQDTGTAILKDQWNTIALEAPYSVSAGTVYHLAFASDTACVGVLSAANTNKDQWGRATYSTFTWASNPTGLISDPFPLVLIQGWGSGGASVTPAAPTRISTALTFKWNAASGATKYQLQVNNGAGFSGTDLLNADVGNVYLREVTGLTAGTTYYWQVRAGNSAGWGAWSTTGSILSN